MAITVHATGFQIVYKDPATKKAMRLSGFGGDPITMTDGAARVINTMIRCLRRESEKNMNQLARVVANYPSEPTDFRNVSDAFYGKLMTANERAKWRELNSLCIMAWETPDSEKGNEQ